MRKLFWWSSVGQCPLFKEFSGYTCTHGAGVGPSSVERLVRGLVIPSVGGEWLCLWCESWTEPRLRLEVPLPRKKEHVLSLSYSPTSCCRNHLQFWQPCGFQELLRPKVVSYRSPESNGCGGGVSR